MKTLSEWLGKIESLHPSSIELGLDRIRVVAHRLGVSSFQSPVVTVTGTNGKGSAVATIEAIAHAHGRSTAAYTSPHLHHFTERLRLNLVESNPQDWCFAFEQVELTRGDISLTYFEFTTLAAFLLIKRASPDLIVLEVGLGGRLDAVNLVDNTISVITSVDYDHEEWLGDSLEKIAYEKSGIVRSNSCVIVGNSTVAELVCSYIPSSTKLIDASSNQAIDYRFDSLTQGYQSRLYPDSLRCGLLVCQQLGIQINDVSILDTALKSACMPGRWQSLNEIMNCWVDVAHNPQAINNLLKKMRRESGLTQWFAICGMLNDKKAEKSIQFLRTEVAQWCFVPTIGVRGQTAHILQEKVKNQIISLDQACFDSEAQALEWCLRHRTRNTGIVVFGSFLVVSNMIEYANNRKAVENGH